MNTTIEVLELRAITAVVERGTFTAAAETLHTDKAHVSRIVSRLEHKLGSQLLQRSTRRLRVTEVGREFYERASGILRALEEAEASVARAMSEPKGTMKLTAGPEYGVLVVNRWIAGYLREFPDVRVEAEFTNRLVDIIHEGFDVAIRLGRLPDSELSARKLGEIEYGLFASPRYLKRRKTPRTPADLAQHDLVMFAPRGRPGWKLAKGSEVHDVRLEPRYLVNNTISAMEMAVTGVVVT
ncbi:MAG: LysR family transcriptional regulator, partial [Myxococcota bacterium]